MTQHIETLSQAIEAIRDICGINKGSVTFTEIVEAVQAIKTDNKISHEHDGVKAVRGWIKAEMCTGCGTTYTMEQLAIAAPSAVSCCPERDMRPTLVPANYGSVTEAARDSLIEQIASALQCPKSFCDYPRILNALHDVINNSHAKSNEIRELEKEKAGLERTLKLLNEQFDQLIGAAGGQNTEGAIASIQKMQRDSGVMERVREYLWPVPSEHSVNSYLESIRDRYLVGEETERQGLAPKTVFLPVGLEAHTADLITSFAENLAQRLVYKQRNGRSGWQFDDWKDDCLRKLHTAEKPLDVAAFAVFAWYHDWAGSYEALVTMPGEFHLPPAGQVVNISINVEGDINGANLDEIVRQALADRKLQDEGPVGFRTE